MKPMEGDLRHLLDGEFNFQRGLVNIAEYYLRAGNFILSKHLELLLENNFCFLPQPCNHPYYFEFQNN